MNIVKAVSVIIGTIIGAGFASGKEIYIFFGQYGKFGIIGAIVSATLTGVIIYSTIAITKRLQIKSNNEFLAKISNSSKLKIILENVINAFLLVSFWIMCAGFCTYGWNYKIKFNSCTNNGCNNYSNKCKKLSNNKFNK